MVCYSHFIKIVSDGKIDSIRRNEKYFHECNENKITTPNTKFCFGMKKCCEKILTNDIRLVEKTWKAELIEFADIGTVFHSTSFSEHWTFIKRRVSKLRLRFYHGMSLQQKT